MNLLGGVAFTGGLIYLVGIDSGKYLSVKYLLENANTPEVKGVLLLGIALLIFAGMTKSAQLPFQSWLLGAMVAPTPVSALLHSSTMVKAGVYLILRLAPAYAGTSLSSMVAAAGAFTFLITSFLAVSQSNAKRVLAYSTIANLGLIVACAGINTPTAISAAIVLIIFHAVSKGLLFLCTGFIEHNIGSRDIEDMEGLADRMPLTTIFVTIGIITMFLPPFGMLVGKWAAIEAASELPVIVLMFVMASAITALFWIKWLGRMLQGTSGEPGQKKESMAAHYLVSLGGLSVAAVLLGIFLIPVIRGLIIPVVQQYYGSPGLIAGGGAISSGQTGAFVFWPLFVLLVLVIVISRLIYSQGGKQATVYLCGENYGLPDSTSYMTTGEAVTELKLSNYYFGNVLDEVRWNKVVNVLAGILIIILVGVTVI
jgi:NADH:ubiquinone oxidoreductase subunit 5 (chain L)/Multisubunit Na+/H+ antiporter, MnhA subunit